MRRVIVTALLATGFFACNPGAGPKGDPGPAGATGAPGPAGATGPAGPTGAVGPMGAPGPAGESVTVEALDAGHPLCPAGGAQVVRSDGGTVLVCHGLEGARGPQGDQGAQGVQGAEGLQGPQGVQGAQGSQGVQGAQGIQGPQGVQGAQGPAGLDGATGTILRATDFSEGWLTPYPTLRRINVGNSFMIFPMWELLAGTTAELVSSVVAPAGTATTVDFRVNVYSENGGPTQPTLAIGHHRLGQQVATSSAQLNAGVQVAAAGNFLSFTYTFQPSAPVQPGDVLHLRLLNMTSTNAPVLLVGATVHFKP